MAASREKIAEWLKEGKEKGASHTAIICDTFDYNDYPLHVTYSRDIVEVATMSNANMQRVIEIYSHEIPHEEQLNEERAWHPTYLGGEKDVKEKKN